MAKTLGKTIRMLRDAKGVTQEDMAKYLMISYQAVSKWENDVASPDIQMLPQIARYFGVSIDELFDYRLEILTDKERFIRFMLDNQILVRENRELKYGGKADYYINSEKFSTNAQIAIIGEAFADCIQENHIQFDALVGMAYHGIAFSTAAADALYNKYGITTNFCFDRKQVDSRGRLLCGYTLKDGDSIIVIDDILTTGRTLDKRIQNIRKVANVAIRAVIVITNRNKADVSGEQMILKKYGAKVYSLVTDEDIAYYLTPKL